VDYGDEFCLNAKLVAEVYHSGAGELGSIVGHKIFRKSKTANDLFPVEFFNPVRRDSSNRLGFHPLSEIVYPYDEELQLSPGQRQKVLRCPRPICGMTMVKIQKSARWPVRASYQRTVGIYRTSLRMRRSLAIDGQKYPDLRSLAAKDRPPI